MLTKRNKRMTDFLSAMRKRGGGGGMHMQYKIGFSREKRRGDRVEIQSKEKRRGDDKVTHGQKVYRKEGRGEICIVKKTREKLWQLNSEKKKLNRRIGE